MGNQQLVAGRNLGNRQSMQGFQTEEEAGLRGTFCDTGRLHRDLQREMKRKCTQEAFGVLISMSSVEQGGYCQAAWLLKDHVSGTWLG